VRFTDADGCRCGIAMRCGETWGECMRGVAIRGATCGAAMRGAMCGVAIRGAMCGVAMRGAAGADIRGAA
jgi:hypothetical protein